MKCVDDCHSYELANMDNPECNQHLHFIEMQPDGTRIDGTTNEEVIEMLIHRLTFLYCKFPSDETDKCIQHLKESLYCLRARTYERQQRGVEGKHKL